MKRMRATAAERSSRKVAEPTDEIKALLQAAANRDVGLVLNLEALKKNADATHAEDGVEAGRTDWLEDGVRRRPPVSENVDEVAFGAIELVGGDRSGTAPAQLYSQLEANKPLAVQMCKKLLCNLGLGLVGHYPELHEAVVVPVIGHADTRAAPGSRTHELACALGFTQSMPTC